MIAHPGISKISFTGSTAYWKESNGMESASWALKGVTLELGGNAATIICPNVDFRTLPQKLLRVPSLTLASSVLQPGEYTCTKTIIHSS
jgi:acyl-CoA reductase-like NAD-dependent aldehyde dehydrogenase